MGPKIQAQRVVLVLLKMVEMAAAEAAAAVVWTWLLRPMSEGARPLFPAEIGLILEAVSTAQAAIFLISISRWLLFRPRQMQRACLAEIGRQETANSGDCATSLMMLT